MPIWKYGNTEIQEYWNTRIQEYRFMYTLEAASPDIQKCVDQVELTSIRDPMRRTDKRLASMEIRPSGNTGIREYGNTGIRKCATYGVNVNSVTRLGCEYYCHDVDFTDQLTDEARQSEHARACFRQLH